VIIPQRSSLFPGLLLKISQNAYTVSTPIAIARIVDDHSISPNITENFCQSAISNEAGRCQEVLHLSLPL